ncbi:hypothetical protein D3Z60_14350 [Lachnospiraceae bacterium]|nr:hypothetical protein [Lachnospiraceae bacterium]
MRGQHYRARDKTVRKMGRDGLTEENLRSGETVRVGRRAADQLALPKAADDSMNFQDRRSCRAEDKKAGGKHRGGYSPDFKRPDNSGAGGTQADFYQADMEKTEPYREDTGDTENYGENGQAMCPEAENIPEADAGIKEGSGRQVPAQPSYRGSVRRKNYIPEPLAARNRRNVRNSRQGKDFHTETEFPGNTSENTSDTGSGSMPDMAAACEDTGTVQNGQGYPSRMENIREKPAGRNGDSGTETEADQDSSRSRRKKQVYDHARKGKERKKTEEGKAASVRREEERHMGNRLSAGQALQISKKDVEKKNRRERLYKEQRKKDSRINFDKEGGMVRGAGMRLAGRAAAKTASLAVSSFTDDGADGQQEDMETEVMHGTKRAGERTLRYAMRQSSRRMQKRNRQAGEGILEADRKKELRKFYQKRRNKKACAEAKRGEKTAEGAAKAAGGFFGKVKSIAADVFRNKKGLLIAAVTILSIFLFFSAGLSSCGAMVQGTSSAFIGTTYPSEEEDIYDAEAGYKELEEALDEQICSMEAAHPGYDEYRCQVDEIAHNPYQLISFLTVLYEEFTYGQIKDILPELFEEQYRLTVGELTEIRTRTETQTVIDPLTGEETETEVEVEYEWHVLCICLTNKGFDTVARDRLTQEQEELYTAYNLTYGNRSYLFDIAGIPTESIGGAGYEIPEEALSDEQFARMIQEAEKYLGRAYVWGGASPETGFDCSGFVSWVINNSGNGWDVGRQTAEGLRGSCAAVSPSEAEPGDLIFFQGTYNTSGASHVGIYAGNGMMIHAGNPIKYSNINTPYWQGHFLSYGRIG